MALTDLLRWYKKRIKPMPAKETAFHNIQFKFLQYFAHNGATWCWYYSVTEINQMYTDLLLTLMGYSVSF